MTIYHHLTYKLPSMFVQKEVFPSSTRFSTENGLDVIYTRQANASTTTSLASSTLQSAWNSTLSSSSSNLSNPINSSSSSSLLSSLRESEDRNRELVFESGSGSSGDQYYSMDVDVFLYPELRGVIERVFYKKIDAVKFTIPTKLNTYVWTFSSKSDRHVDEDWWKPVVDTIVYSFELSQPTTTG